MMLIERIYRELLLSALMGLSRVKQKDLAERCGVSLGLVNKAVRKLELAGAIEPTRQGVRILSPPRILNLWATERRLTKDVLFSFRADPLEKVERELPSDAILTAFSAWVSLSGSRPAEYSRIYFYIQDERGFERWLGFRRGDIRKTNPNVFALRGGDPHLMATSRGGIAPIPQIYVDIYSIEGPEAPPYLRDITQAHPELALW
jgi:DNA-binding Lrp family transcriptional regulator